MEDVVPVGKKKGRDRWYEASCPFCAYTQEATVLSSEEAAGAAAKGKIRFHVLSEHTEEVDPADLAKKYG